MHLACVLFFWRTNIGMNKAICWLFHALQGKWGVYVQEVYRRSCPRWTLPQKAGRELFASSELASFPFFLSISHAFFPPRNNGYHPPIFFDRVVQYEHSDGICRLVAYYNTVHKHRTRFIVQVPSTLFFLKRLTLQVVAFITIASALSLLFGLFLLPLDKLAKQQAEMVLLLFFFGGLVFHRLQ